MNYSDSPDNFKLSLVNNRAQLTRRNIGIMSMWLTALKIPESLHEFVVAILVSGNWDDLEEDQISLKRMARNISPGLDSDDSIRRAYERLKKSGPRFFQWQEDQLFTLISHRLEGYGTRSLSFYKFHHYILLVKLFNLDENLPQKRIRAIVADSLKDFPLPKDLPKQRRRRKPETVASSIARAVEELLSLVDIHTAGIYISDACRQSLGDEVVEEIKKSL